MTSDTHPAPGATGLRLAPPLSRAAAGALVLIAAADWLFWDQPVGISLAVFAVALAMAVAAASPAPADRVQATRALAGLALGVLPVVELTQTLSVLFLAAGLVAFTLGWSGRATALGARDAGYLVGFPVVGPIWLIRDIEATAVRAGSAMRPGSLVAWVLPGALCVLFLMLFTAANPVIEGWAEAVLAIEIFEQPWRIAFWGAALLAVWPFLRLAARALPAQLEARALRLAVPGACRAMVSESSATGALVLFNAIFAVETVLDLIYLWGGAELPQGMTYATYAHRGAYPLVATALMAGGFVIFATSVLTPTPIMLRLIYLWIGQNILLLVSAVLRLNLYVEVYALTHLRVAAFIWMGLVALGFVLLVARLVLGKDNRWLVIRNLAAGAAVLYACCFVNFADLIARYNIAHSRLAIGEWRPLDDQYICGLGPHALPAILEHEQSSGTSLCRVGSAGTRIFSHHVSPRKSWREWGFRDWRLRRELLAPGFMRLP